VILDKGLQDCSLLDVMYNDHHSSKLKMTLYTQPSLFILKYSLSKLLMKLGVESTLVLSHSVGEYVASCLTRYIFSLERDALTFVVSSDRLMQGLPENGSMVVLNINENKVIEKVRNNPPVLIEAINRLNNIVLSGKKSEINEIFTILTEKKGVHAIPLQVSHSFHSLLMKPMLKGFKNIVEKINCQTPIIPFISNITGRNENTKPTNANYWW